MRVILSGLVVLTLLFIMASCTSWRWQECRKVGHGVAYCTWSLSR